MPIGWIGYILYVLYCNVQVYMAQPTWPKTAALLRILVAEYLQEFQNLYPRASFLPEMVYFVHLPDQVVLYRPLRHHWCMHFETKNRFIKLRKWWQLVNIWLSVARYHQIYMIYRQIGCLDELLQNYLYSSNIFCEGELALTTVFHPASLCRFHMQLVMHFLPGHGKMCGVERGNKSKCTTLRSKNCYILWDRSIDNFHLIFLLWNDSIQPIPLKFLSIPHLHLQQTDKGESIWPMQAWIIRC